MQSRITGIYGSVLPIHVVLQTRRTPRKHPTLLGWGLLLRVHVGTSQSRVKYQWIEVHMFVQSRIEYGSAAIAL